MEKCMRNTCQFCDENPGFLQKFAKGWVCNQCCYEYGLTNHDLLANEVEIDEEYVDDEYTMWDGQVASGFGGQYTGYGWEGYEGYDCHYKPGLGYYNKPKKAEVTIEELECDPSDLALATRYVHTLAGATKAEVKVKKWTVDIYD